MWKCGNVEVWKQNITTTRLECYGGMPPSCTTLTRPFHVGHLRWMIDASQFSCARCPIDKTCMSSIPVRAHKAWKRGYPDPDSTSRSRIPRPQHQGSTSGPASLPTSHDHFHRPLLSSVILLFLLVSSVANCHARLEHGHSPRQTPPQGK